MFDWVLVRVLSGQPSWVRRSFYLDNSDGCSCADSSSGTGLKTSVIVVVTTDVRPVMQWWSSKTWTWTRNWTEAFGTLDRDLCGNTCRQQKCIMAAVWMAWHTPETAVPHEESKHKQSYMLKLWWGAEAAESLVLYQFLKMCTCVCYNNFSHHFGMSDVLLI